MHRAMLRVTSEPMRTGVLGAEQVPTPLRPEVRLPVELVLMREAAVTLGTDLLGACTDRVGRVGEEGKGTDGRVGREEGGTVIVKGGEEPV